MLDYQVIKFTKTKAQSVVGSMTTTSKMPCNSFELPTANCITGAKMSLVAGSICSKCYAKNGSYKVYEKAILNAQNNRLANLYHADWVSAMVASIGKQSVFRWHSSGDIQSIAHLHNIALVALAMPTTRFWLPTREYSMIADYLKQYGSLPSNLIVRLSAMFIDKPVIIPKSLQGFSNITASNVHSLTGSIHGQACIAPTQNGECRDCRACWNTDIKTVSYLAH